MMALRAFFVLAQQSAFDQARPVLLWIGAIIVLVLIGGVLIIKLRESTRAEGKPGRGGDGSLLEEIRRMRADGRISDGEYQTMRSRLTTRLAANMGVGAAPARSGQAPNNPAVTPALIATRERAVKAPPGYDLTGAPLPERSAE